MQWHGFRIPIILLALVLGLSAFLGAQWLYNKYNYLQPLEDFLVSSPAVQTYEIEESGKVLTLTVELHETSNLAIDYRELQREVSAVLGKRPFVIQLADSRDQVLRQVFYDSQFSIYEALARGNFREMADYVKASATEVGAKATIYLDQDYIYVHMEHNGRQLTEVIPRPEGGFTNTAHLSLTGGGNKLD